MDKRRCPCCNSCLSYEPSGTSAEEQRLQVNAFMEDPTNDNDYTIDEPMSPEATAACISATTKNIHLIYATHGHTQLGSRDDDDSNDQQQLYVMSE